jgi:hypothetical protein
VNQSENLNNASAHKNVANSTGPGVSPSQVLGNAIKNATASVG